VISERKRVGEGFSDTIPGTHFFMPSFFRIAASTEKKYENCPSYSSLLEGNEHTSATLTKNVAISCWARYIRKVAKFTPGVLPQAELS